MADEWPASVGPWDRGHLMQTCIRQFSCSRCLQVIVTAVYVNSNVFKPCLLFYVLRGGISTPKQSRIYAIAYVHSIHFFCYASMHQLDDSDIVWYVVQAR